MKKVLLIFILALYTSCFSQQEAAMRFLKVFNTKNYSERIQMLDTLSDVNKSLYYPYLKDSIDVIRKKAYTDHKVDAINKIDKIDGIRLFHDHNYSQAIPVLLKVINTNKTLNDLDSLKIYFYLKNSYFKIRSISKALEIDKTLEMFKKRNKTYDKWCFYPRLSNIYNELGIYTEAIKQQRREFAESNEKNNNTFLSFHNNEGVFWNRLKQSDSALVHFQLAKKYAEKCYHNSDKPSEKFVLGLIDGNIGQVYKEQKKYKEAIPLLKEDTYWSRASNNLDNASISYNELGECYISLGNYTMAEKYLDSARIILSKFEDVNPRLVNIRLYGLLYEKSGNYTESLRRYKQYIKSSDSLNIAEKQKDLISQQVALQLDEKERIIKKKQAIIDKEAENIIHQNMVRRTLFAGLLFLMLTLIIVFTLYRRTNRQKQLLEIKNEEIKQKNSKIEKSLEDKDFLVREVHHRVKNNLQIISSLLNLQINKTLNHEVKIALSEARQRILSIAFVHRLLYRNKELVVIPVKEYFESLLQQLEETFSEKQSGIILNKHIADIYLDLDRSIPLGLIINEIISNAYKHAFPNNKGVIDISFKEVNKVFELKIKDNGVGFDHEFNLDSTTSFGVEIIKILIEQINGKLNFDNTHGGTLYTITFT